MNIDGVRALLREDVATVSFIKKSGELREMICTLLPQYLPEVSGTSVPSDEIVTVWDLENAAWRSFRMDSVIKIEVDNNTYVMQE